MDMSAEAAALSALTTPALTGLTPMATGGGADGIDGAVGLADLTVMMIDDEPMLTEVIGTYLEDAGYRHCVGINDATVALEKVRELNPALVLLDLVMPGVSGFEILQALVHKIESVVNQLRGLIRGHEGAAPEGGRSKRSTNV